MNQSVAIILLNWNSYIDTSDCMKSLECLSYPSFHVYVVDNASTDGSRERLAKEKDEDRYMYNWSYLTSSINRGFAGGNNLAIQDACEKGFEYIWLLNNDTLVEECTLTELVLPLQQQPYLGITGSKIYFAGSNKLWFAGGKINPRNGAHAHIGMRKEDRGQFDQAKDVGYIVGCSLLIRTSIVKDIGPLEEDYFLYYEDVDWNLKAKNTGWGIHYVPSSVVWHKVSQSVKSSDLSALSTYYIIRNAYVMAQKFNKNRFQFRACLRLLRNIVWYHMKIIIRRQEQKRKRSALIFAAVADALRGRTGKYEKQLVKMGTLYGTRKSG